MYFAAITATVSVTTIPEQPLLGSNLTLLCQVETEELLLANGTICLQLPNNTVISDSIGSSTATLSFELNPFTINDKGKYYCNASITSPEFPMGRLFAFEGFTLESASKYGKIVICRLRLANQK